MSLLFWTSATVAAKNAVVIPTVATTFNAVWEYSKIGEHLTTKKTPAVTIVAAWISADTGVGAYHVAIFHLFTHAFFKALLFLGSGCVIHSFNEEQDIRSMGGVWKKIPYTYVLMIIGTLALTGFPFLSGYYSKDAIIAIMLRVKINGVK